MVAVGLYGVAAGVLVLAAGVVAVWAVVLDVLERVDVLMLRVRPNVVLVAVADANWADFGQD